MLGVLGVKRPLINFRMDGQVSVRPREKGLARACEKASWVSLELEFKSKVLVQGFDRLAKF